MQINEIADAVLFHVSYSGTFYFVQALLASSASRKAAKKKKKKAEKTAIEASSNDIEVATAVEQQFCN